MLTKAMVNHPIPRLFVSRRTDKSPNRFNCAVCRKDVSFLSRGPRGIWRHFKCKGHYLKDRRYRLDHEDVIHSENLDAIPVAEVSAELRAEIELTPPVTLGRMNKFVEDEVDALVGVPSNVPPTTLVGCLFELLRSGESQVFLRRLWNQFRTTLPVESPYASVSWSKTETLVVIVQTLFPHVLRRVKSWLGDSPLSLALQSSLSGVKCVVRCCPDDVRSVWLMWSLAESPVRRRFSVWLECCRLCQLVGAPFPSKVVLLCCSMPTWIGVKLSVDLFQLLLLSSTVMFVV